LDIIWHILLTICLGSNCIEQDVQWFDTENECKKMLEVYADIPGDGDWDSVTYQCKPFNSVST